MIQFCFIMNKKVQMEQLSTRSTAAPSFSRPRPRGAYVGATRQLISAQKKNPWADHLS